MEAACQNNIGKLTGLATAHLIIFVDLRCKTKGNAQVKLLSLQWQPDFTREIAQTRYKVMSKAQTNANTQIPEK